MLRLAISLAFFGLLFYLMRDHIPEILRTLRNVDRRLFVISVCIFLFTIAVLAKRLQLIFAAEDLTLPFAESVNLTFVGYFFNNFLPTSVGGDIVKAMCASRITKQTMKSVTSVLMDRIFGLFTFILIPSVSIVFLKDLNPAVPVIVYSFLIASVFFFFLVFNRGIARRLRFIETLLGRFRLDEKVRRVYDGMHNFKNHKRVVAEAMLLSIVGQSISILVLYILAIAIGARTSPIYFYLLVPIVHLISMLPSLNGFGIREGAYVFLLKPYIGEPAAAAIGILWLVLLLILSVIGGVVYLMRQDYHPRLGEPAIG
ncbi:MAG TPA: lysylphosphatidylglycerol synthase transmembrane domain-containing protein [Candidatus Eisenbacteria bacterium]|nr:lysylphosphatidylglycerol synthase transmembrane domain-containing protein [Candidatus Eisenbacteria bacterium]